MSDSYGCDRASRVKTNQSDDRFSVQPACSTTNHYSDSESQKVNTRTSQRIHKRAISLIGLLMALAIPSGVLAQQAWLFADRPGLQHCRRRYAVVPRPCFNCRTQSPLIADSRASGHDESQGPGRENYFFLSGE